MQKVELEEKKSYIPLYNSTNNWKRPSKDTHWNINFSSVNEEISQKMKLNSIMESEALN